MDGYSNYRYMLVTFQARKDNRGNMRLFRTIWDHSYIHAAIGAFHQKVCSGKFLRVELLKKQDLQVLAQWGDEDVEDHWVDERLR